MRGTTLILLAAVLWGTTGTAQALGPAGTTPLGVGALRLILGGSVLAGVAWFGRTSADLRWLRHPATLIAAIGMAGYQPAFFSSVDRTGVAVGTMVTIGSGPVFVGLIVAMLSRTRPARQWVMATAPALAGLVVLGLASDDAAVDVVGIAFALVAGLAYASYAVAATQLARIGPAHESAGVIFGLAAIFLVPVVATQYIARVASAAGTGTVLWLGIGATAAAYLLFTSGLTSTDAGTAATLSLAEPITATILGVFVLSERPSILAWFGVALIAAGLSLAAKR